MASDDLAARRVEGRDCNGCTQCCRVLGIAEIRKPPGRICPDCTEGEGCTIYAHRPQTCRTFYCGFLIMKDLDEAWRPSVSKLIVLFDGEENRVRVHVDERFPDAWRKQPYYAKLKAWAVTAAARGIQLIVRIGDHAFAMLPDRDIDLGIVGDDDVIVTEETAGADGPVLNVLKLRADDPRAAALRRPSPWMAGGN